MSEVPERDILIYGNSSLNVMFDTVSRAMTHGIMGNTPWCKLDKVKDVYKRQIYAYVRGDCPDLSMCDGGRWLWEMDDSKLAQYNEKEKKLS